MHPIGFFSAKKKKVSPVEQNYDLINQELVAVTLGLEGLRHCLEGTTQPFVVLIGHMNLEYLHLAKGLNP